MAFDWKSVIKTIAPVLGTALGGPVGGAALSVLSQTILGKTGGTEEELAQVLAGGLKPETMLALKEADQKFQLEMRRLDLESDKAAIDNTKDARSRDVELAKTGHRNYRQDVLAYGAIAGFFVVMYTLLTQALPDGLARDALLILLGTLTKIVSDIYNYDFGSSAGSTAKTALIDRMMRK